MTSVECFENKWFYMKYIGKYLSEKILLTSECMYKKEIYIIKDLYIVELQIRDIMHGMFPFYSHMENTCMTASFH